MKIYWLEEKKGRKDLIENRQKRGHVIRTCTLYLLGRPPTLSLSLSRSTLILFFIWAKTVLHAIIAPQKLPFIVNECWPGNRYAKRGAKPTYIQTFVCSFSETHLLKLLWKQCKLILLDLEIKIHIFYALKKTHVTKNFLSTWAI